MTAIKLLLSTFARANWGARIAAANADAELSFITSEEAIADAGPCDADIAFMTREVTGRSSKNNDSPELTVFQTILRRSSRLQWLHIHPAGAERPIGSGEDGVWRDLASVTPDITGEFLGTGLAAARDVLDRLPVVPQIELSLFVARTLTGEAPGSQISSAGIWIRPPPPTTASTNPAPRPASANRTSVVVDGSVTRAL